MLFDSLGLPKDVGATDKMDSARLAGLMVTIGYKADGINLDLYTKYNEDAVLQGVRHPEEVPANNYKNFTRDQLGPLVCGLNRQGKAGTAEKLYLAAIDRNYRGQNTEADVVGSTKKFPNGADLFSPAFMNHLSLSGSQGSSFLGSAWLIMDICFNGLFTPRAEPNQIFCMCEMAGPNYVRFWKKMNPAWKLAIIDYSITSYRDEKDLGLAFIDYVDKYGEFKWTDLLLKKKP